MIGFPLILEQGWESSIYTCTWAVKNDISTRGKRNIPGCQVSTTGDAYYYFLQTKNDSLEYF